MMYNAPPPGQNGMRARLLAQMQGAGAARPRLRPIRGSRWPPAPRPSSLPRLPPRPRCPSGTARCRVSSGSCRRRASPGVVASSNPRRRCRNVRDDEPDAAPAGRWRLWSPVAGWHAGIDGCGTGRAVDTAVRAAGQPQGEAMGARGMYGGHGGPPPNAAQPGAEGGCCRVAAMAAAGGGMSPQAQGRPAGHEQWAALRATGDAVDAAGRLPMVRGSATRPAGWCAGQTRTST